MLSSQRPIDMFRYIVASHLSSLMPLPVSSFPYSSSIPGNTFSGIPELQAFAPEMDLLVQANLHADGTMPEEYAIMHDSAAKALKEAMRDQSAGLQKLSVFLQYANEAS